jgi:alpha-galactosidase
MLPCRNPALENESAHSACDNFNGPQIANPQKFPDGVSSVVEYIKSKGLKLGLYTARAVTTCAGYAGSCMHESVDAKQWAAWGVEYSKCC